jgi:hypothetical protein
MVTNRICTICAIDEASLYCRLCSKYYCWEHPCTHLSAAHEDNSYTQRLGDNYNEDLGSGESSRTTTIQEPAYSIGAVPIQSDRVSIQSYSDGELHAAYDYHRTQTRRIRAELERRALFATGVVPTEHLSSLYYGQKLASKRTVRSRKLPKSHAASISLLCASLRRGNISVEYIKCKLEQYSK